MTLSTTAASQDNVRSRYIPKCGSGRGRFQGNITA